MLVPLASPGGRSESRSSTCQPTSSTTGENRTLPLLIDVEARADAVGQDVAGELVRARVPAPRPSRRTAARAETAIRWRRDRTAAGSRESPARCWRGRCRALSAHRRSARSTFTCAVSACVGRVGERQLRAGREIADAALIRETGAAAGTSAAEATAAAARRTRRTARPARTHPGRRAAGNSGRSTMPGARSGRIRVVTRRRWPSGRGSSRTSRRRTRRDPGVWLCRPLSKRTRTFEPTSGILDVADHAAAPARVARCRVAAASAAAPPAAAARWPLVGQQSRSPPRPDALTPTQSRRGRLVAITRRDPAPRLAPRNGTSSVKAISTIDLIVSSE